MISLAVLVRVRVGLQSTPSNVALMAFTYLLAALPFFAGGAVVSIAIARLSASVNRVYGADLLGAAAACLVLMPALNRLGAPGAIVAAGVIGGVAAILFASPSARGRLIAVVGVVAVAILGMAASPLAPFTVSITKGHEHHAVLFSKWNSFSRIGVYDQPVRRVVAERALHRPAARYASHGHRLGGRNADPPVSTATSARSSTCSTN